MSHWLHKMHVYLVHNCTPEHEWIYIADSYLCGSAETTWAAARKRRERACLPAHTWKEFCDEMISLHGELFVAQAARQDLKQFRLPVPLNASSILDVGRVFRQKAAVVADNPGPFGRVCPCDEDTLCADWMLMLERGGAPGEYLHTTCYAAVQASQIAGIAEMITLTCKTVALGNPALLAPVKSHMAVMAEGQGVKGVKRERCDSVPSSGGHRDRKQQVHAPKGAPAEVGASTTGGYVSKEVFASRLALKLCPKCASPDHLYAEGGCLYWKKPKGGASGPAPSG